MCEKKTLVLCGMADAYYFPAVPNVHWVFSHPKENKFLTIAKIARELNLPFFHCFFGDWKKDLLQYDQVIIFDLGYQPRMEKYLLKINPNLLVYYYNWNTVDNDRKVMKIDSFYDREKVFCTDPESCVKYNLKFKDIFYSKEWVGLIRKKYKEITVEDKVLWLGQDKGRLPWLINVKKTFDLIQFKSDIRCVSRDSNDNPFYWERPMPYEEYCIDVCGCSTLLDINQPGQTAKTMRVMEALFFQKKLITNNTLALKFEFYNKNNILVINPDELDVDAVKEFLELPFIMYPDEVLRRYDYEYWKNDFAN